MATLNPNPMMVTDGAAHHRVQDTSQVRIDGPGEVLRRHGLAPKHAWGQNFLGDPRFQDRIAALAQVGPGHTVVELGAGLGHLTAALARTGARVVAVERDRELVPVLRAHFADVPTVQILEADAASIDLRGIDPGGGPVTVVGNLPYHVGSAIVFNVIDQWQGVRRLVVMLQREVAERLAAEPGTEAYGLPSVLLQQVADVTVALQVPRGAFVPPPAVESAVAVASFRAAPRAPVVDPARFDKVVRAAFSQRRKTLWNTLRGAFESQSVRAALEAAAIDPQRRGETLSVEEFAAIERGLGPIASD
jgi:16S rRNA (adenine1518-N6/adenine1519-N6)-dimethyltransferase